MWLLSTMQMSQHPKIGPFSGLQATANWAKFKLNLSFMSKEKIKDSKDLSAAQCFLEEFQAMGVYPPITLSNSVFTNSIVLGILSQISWNLAAENPCSLALNISENLAGVFLKIDLMYSTYWVIWLSSWRGKVEVEKVVEAIDSVLNFLSIL